MEAACSKFIYFEKANGSTIIPDQRVQYYLIVYIMLTDVRI